MIKLIVGIKGTGKTKQLIDLANKAIETTKGAVICVSLTRTCSTALFAA